MFIVYHATRNVSISMSFINLMMIKGTVGVAWQGYKERLPLKSEHKEILFTKDILYP